MIKRLWKRPPSLSGNHSISNVLPAVYSTAIIKPANTRKTKVHARLVVTSCNSDTTTSRYISSNNKRRRPTRSESLPIQRLPAKPIKVPAPIKPTHTLETGMTFCAAAMAEPLIWMVNPQTNCPRMIAKYILRCTHDNGARL